MSDVIHVIGAGLAGSEAAWQAAHRGAFVVLHEMRPACASAAHRTPHCAELVGSASFRAEDTATAHGMLKAELRRLGSLLQRIAEATRLPGQHSLEVHRAAFAEHVTRALEAHPRITIVREQVGELPEGPVIVAAGPLLAQPLARTLFRVTGSLYSFAYRGTTPIVEGSSVDRSRAFQALRPDTGDDLSLNCPLTREQFEAFSAALAGAQTGWRPEHDPAEELPCYVPVEALAAQEPAALARRAFRTMELTDPATGERPAAVVHLRPEAPQGHSYALVGCQTALPPAEQERVFALVPGLEGARFVRYGAMLRGAYLDAPAVLEPTGRLRARRDAFCAGALCGLEGYLEAIGSGWLAGVNAVRLLAGEEPVSLPPETMLGALMGRLCEAGGERGGPLTATFGLLRPLDDPARDRQARRGGYAPRGMAALEAFVLDSGLGPSVR